MILIWDIAEEIPMAPTWVIRVGQRGRLESGW
jgi:hypothetical protein